MSRERLSPNEFKRMLDLIWPEIEEELEGWIKDLHMLLEDPGLDTSLKEFHQAQGSLQAIRNVLSLPSVLLEQKQSEMEEEEDGTRD